MLDEIFKNIDEDKRKRIINSAFEEFSKNGFKKASTNEIVKNAKVSKGILFHYFGNKQGLYDKLIEYALDLIIDSLEEGINWEESDFFLRAKRAVIIKASMTNRFPYIYEFLMKVFEGMKIEEVQLKTMSHSAELMNKTYTHNIDFTLFKDNLDMTVTMNIIKWTFEKMGADAWGKSLNQGTPLDVELLNGQSDTYIKALRRAFYKNEMED